MSCDCRRRYTFRTARGERELEAVFRFRYEHFFQCFAAGYPGIDHAKQRLFEPHDWSSIHHCVFDESGNLCAVSTATPAQGRHVPPSWRDWFKLDGISGPDLDRVVISSRMVIRPDHRGRELFTLFHRHIMMQYLASGFDHAVHCCSPGLICRYEALGHRLYGQPFVIPSGLLRVSMFIALKDPDHLVRVGSPVAGLCAGGSLPGIFNGLECKNNFRLLSREERLEYVRSRLGPGKFGEIGRIVPEIAHASPLCLAAGLSHTPPPNGGFPCLVISGAIKELLGNKIAGPGSLVGEDLLRDPLSPASPFTVMEDSEVLVFDRTALRRLGAGRRA